MIRAWGTDVNKIECNARGKTRIREESDCNSPHPLIASMALVDVRIKLKTQKNSNHQKGITGD